VLSRRQKGSANRARARHRVAVLHRKVRQARCDHAHKTALRLVRGNQAVYAEDLAVNGLMCTKLPRAVVAQVAARPGEGFRKLVDGQENRNAPSGSVLVAVVPKSVS
jgi:transposase